MKGGEGPSQAGGPGDAPSFVEAKEKELETGCKRWEERRAGEKEMKAEMKGRGWGE